MKHSLVVAGCCAAVLVAGCRQFTSPAAPSVVRSDATPLSSSAGIVPFNGSLEGQYGTPAGQFPLISESIVATGHATHLGHYRLDIAETVNLLQATATGTFTFTAANGDTLYGSYTGRAQLGPPVAILESASVLGGTGRFAGAEELHHQPPVRSVKRTTTGSFEGTILAGRWTTLRSEGRQCNRDPEAGMPRVRPFTTSRRT